MELASEYPGMCYYYHLQGLCKLKVATFSFTVGEVTPFSVQSAYFAIKVAEELMDPCLSLNNTSAIIKNIFSLVCQY